MNRRISLDDLQTYDVNPSHWLVAGLFQLKPKRASDAHSGPRETHDRQEGGWINQPVGPKPMSARISQNNDKWNNPFVRDPLESGNRSFLGGNPKFLGGNCGWGGTVC